MRRSLFLLVHTNDGEFMNIWNLSEKIIYVFKSKCGEKYYCLKLIFLIQ